MPIIPISGSAVARGALVPIGSVRLLTDTSGISFANIPQIYTDLFLVTQSRATGVFQYSGEAMNLNSDVGFNYSRTTLVGNGSAVSSYRVTTADNYFNWQSIPAAALNFNIFGMSEYHFLNYANTTAFKTVIHRSANPGINYGYGIAEAGLYRSTAGITRIDLGTSVSFGAGSTATLYGVRSIGR
jgi:hypothetical protein